LVRPDTVLRWHRDLLARRHAARSRPAGAGGVEHYARSGFWCCGWPARTAAGGYRRLHGELGQVGAVQAHQPRRSTRRTPAQPPAGATARPAGHRIRRTDSSSAPEKGRRMPAPLRHAWPVGSTGCAVNYATARSHTDDSPGQRPYSPPVAGGGHGRRLARPPAFTSAITPPRPGLLAPRTGTAACRRGVDQPLTLPLTPSVHGPRPPS